MGGLFAAVDAWQRRHTAPGFAVGVIKKFGEDRASNFAALLAYYAFFSLFPLLLVLVSVLGFVLEGNPSLQEDILDTALARIPVIGTQLTDDVGSLTGSGVALAIGLAGALWAGLGVTLAMGRAFDTIWDVPRKDQPNALKARARGMAVLAVIAIALAASTVLSGLAAGGGLGSTGTSVLALAGTFTGNAVAFLAVFALLTSGGSRRVRALLPGVVLCSAGSLVLQAAGGWYVEHTIVDASEIYGTFALVIGLLSWFWLGSHLLLIAAEVNVVLHRRLWPRALTGELEPADEEVLERTALAAQADARQEIAVTFRR
jgi:YihY family inner membrane protein